MIEAEGKKNGKRILVQYDGSKFLFNNEENEPLEIELLGILNEKPAIFGTYHAEDPWEDLNIIGVLQVHFFDKPAEVKTDQEIKTEWEPGLIY